jgi:hypothetical protein
MGTPFYLIHVAFVSHANDHYFIHSGKLMEELGYYLRDKHLAIDIANPYDGTLGGWLAVRPGLGDAVMSVIAIAIARHKGLDIVTSSGLIHHALAVLDEQEAINRLLGTGRDTTEAKADEKAGQLAQMVMTTYFDFSKLKAQHIAELIKDGKDLRAFKASLMELLDQFPKQLILMNGKRDSNKNRTKSSSSG